MKIYMFFYKCLTISSLFFLCNNDIYGQEVEKQLGKNFISGSFGYSHVKEATSIGGSEAEGRLVPSVGINYFRRASEYAKFGLMTDVELDNYLVFGKDLERENVLIVVAAASFEFHEHFVLLGGFGREFDNNERFKVVRIGAEFPFHLKKGMAIEPEFLLDLKEGYNVYTFGVAFGLHF